MAKNETEQQQTTITTPGPMPVGGQEIWGQFLDRMFGTPHLTKEEWDAYTPQNEGDFAKPYGHDTYERYLETPEYRSLEDLIRGNNEYQRTQFKGLMDDAITPAYNQFGEGLDYIAGSGGRYEDRMAAPAQSVISAQDRSAANPINVKGGGGNFNLLSQGGINMAKDRYEMDKNVQDKRLLFNSSVLPSLNSQRLAARTGPAQTAFDFNLAHNPAAVQADYITQNLGPLAGQMQGFSYGLPSGMTSGSGQSSASYGALGNFGQIMNTIGNMGISGQDLYKGFGKAVDWAGDGIGYITDLFSGWGGGGDSGGGGGITYT